MGATSRNPGSRRFLSVGVSGTSSLDQEGLFSAPGLAHPPDPREQPASKDLGPPQPHVASPTCAQRAAAPPLPPHILTLTLAHPVAARHAWSPPRAPRRRGSRNRTSPILPGSPFLPASSHPPGTHQTRRLGPPSPQQSPRVSPGARPAVGSGTRSLPQGVWVRARSGLRQRKGRDLTEGRGGA